MFRIAKYRMGVAAALLAVGLAACGDDQGPSDEPQFTTLRLTIGQQIVNITAANCALSGGPIVVPTGTTAVTAQYLLTNGNPDPLVSNATFNLNITLTNTALATWVATGAFGGSFTRLAAGATTATIALFHNAEQHNDLECANVAITVE